MKKINVIVLAICFPILLFAQSVKIVTNQVGYEFDGAKKAIIVSDSKIDIASFKLIDTKDNKEVYSGQPAFKGSVDKWKNFQFWTMDFSSFTTSGIYKLQVSKANGPISSYPFVIGKNVLEQATLSDVIYYFKGQRSSGLLDKADRHSHLQDKTDTIDAHGG